MANSKKQNITITAGLAVLVSVGGGVLAWDRIDGMLHGSLAQASEVERVERKTVSNRQFAGENRLNLLNIMFDRKQELLAKINLAISLDGSNPALRASKQDIESSIRLIMASIKKLGGA
jgi:hypothetical protein